MSQDIRSFFSIVAKKSGTNSTPSPSKPTKKETHRIIDSDDDVIADTPEQKHPLQKKKQALVSSVSSGSDPNPTPPKKKVRTPSKRASPRKRKTVQLISSDSEDDFPPSKTKTPLKQTTSRTDKKLTKEFPKLKAINIDDIFKKTPVKQSKVEFVPLKPELDAEKTTMKKATTKKRKKSGKNNEEIATHDDLSFQQTLLALDEDDDLLMDNADLLDKTIENAMKDPKKTSTQSGKNKEEIATHEDLFFQQTLLALDEDADALDTTIEDAVKVDNHPKESHHVTPSGRKRARNDSVNESTPKRTKLDHTDSGIDPGQEAYEKKRYSAMLYQKYLNRGGPKHLGEKKYPEGKPDCLQNLCFLRTGVLDSLDSDEFSNIVKKHGGRIVQSVSKKVNYLIVGDEPGPSKLDKAKGLSIPFLSEDEFLDLILTKSGMEATYCKENDQVVSEDYGIGSGSSHNDSFEEQHIKTEIQEPRAVKSPTKKKTPEVEKAKAEKVPKKETTSKKGEKSEKNYPAEDSKPINRFNKKLETKMEQVPRVERPEVKIANENMSLADKYKPIDLKGIIGQQNDNSSAWKLKNWLMKWHHNQRSEVKKHIIKPSPWAKNDDGAAFKCALLSGPPGIGKTTTATLVAKSLGLDIVEFNASDTRSKRLLHEEVSQLLTTQTIVGFMKEGQGKTDKKRVLLMDEVDGMAGNEDRGGMQELIQLIKSSSIPIICMCNDRNHQKIRSLANYCFDLKFTKPTVQQIRGAFMSICFKEKLTISPKILTEIIEGTACDVRQSLNHLSFLAISYKDLTVEEARKRAQTAKKDAVLGPWEVCRTVFTKSEHKDMSVADKLRLFFHDYSLGPLFVQENYLKVQPDGCDKKETLRRVAAAADSISLADTIDSKIRRTNNWALLETEAMFGSVFPGYFMSGNLTKMISFPGWLGKNSRKNKFQRLLGEVQAHTRTTTSASKLAIKLDYLVPLRNAILHPLRTNGLEGVSKAVEVMKQYNLLREDLDSLVELSQWSSRSQNPKTDIESKVKSAFTRTYNKEVPLLPFAADATAARKKTAAVAQDLDSELMGIPAEDADEDSDKDDGDISKIPAIKVKTKIGAGKIKTNEAGTSKKGAGKRGKGKKK